LASELPNRRIRVPILLWRRVILDLRRRGAGRRESGCFLLGVSRGATGTTKEYVCYDDLDPNAYQGGGIAFHAAGCAALWTHCRERHLEILADVHTHGGTDTCQSDIDRRNPMIPLVGHTALIVPLFAHTRWWLLDGVGVYAYLGHFKWRTFGADRSQRIALALW
jgi:proteasome lid subunit RPN8/RPN11